MKAFLVTGSYRHGRGRVQFTKEVAAADPEGATERVLSDVGSKHGVKRAFIEIKAVAEVPADKVESSVVRYMAGGGA